MIDSFHTREQRYAAAVFKRIEQFINKDEVTRKKYGSLAHKLPVLIRTAGLVQALIFVQARNKEDTNEKQSPQRQLLRDLASVLAVTSILEGAEPFLQEDTLDQQKQKDRQRLAFFIERSREADFEEYMRLTEGALETLLWFKRFAQSELKVELGDEVEENRNAIS